MTQAMMHHKILTVLVAYDRKQSTKRFYNPYALAHYCGALSRAMSAMELGSTPREALVSTFCGPLLDKALKAIGETKSTDREQRV